MKKLIAANAMHMPSGVPIKSAVLLRVMKDPVTIPRRRWDQARDRMVHQCDPTARRVYVGGNNHHIEIRQNRKGDWIGKVVTAYEAARRIRPARNCKGSRAEPTPPVDRSDHEDARFIMSLAEGETVHMKHPKTAVPGYFVVFKLDKPHTVHFVSHYDARTSKATDSTPAREDVAVTVGNLTKLGPEDGAPPYKVAVDPLGRARRIND